MKQGTFAQYHGFARKPLKTRKAEYLKKMNEIVPWDDLLVILKPYFPETGRGRPRRNLEQLFRMFCISLWYNLAYAACEEACYDTQVFADFCGFDLGNEGIPDATTLENFRHTIEQNKLGETLFRTINRVLVDHGVTLSQGTIVDASLISAPSSSPSAELRST